VVLRKVLIEITLQGLTQILKFSFPGNEKTSLLPILMLLMFEYEPLLSMIHNAVNKTRQHQQINQHSIILRTLLITSVIKEVKNGCYKEPK
jgi:hypothetical protein